MRPILRLIKIWVAISTIIVIVAMSAAWMGIDLRIHTIFGHSVFIDVVMLGVTYTKIGKLYFTDKFRYMIYLLLLVSILETINCIYPFSVTAYFNACFSVPIIALAIIVVLKIIRNAKQLKTIKSDIA